MSTDSACSAGTTPRRCPEAREGAEEIVLVTRALDDRPFIQSFGEHYLALGVRCMIVLAKSDHSKEVRSTALSRKTLPLPESA